MPHYNRHSWCNSSMLNALRSFNIRYSRLSTTICITAQHHNQTSTESRFLTTTAASRTSLSNQQEPMNKQLQGTTNSFLSTYHDDINNTTSRCIFTHGGNIFSILNDQFDNRKLTNHSLMEAIYFHF